MDMHEMRREYKKCPLRKEDLTSCPFETLKKWINNSKSKEPNAFTLSTSTKEGIPSARTILLKEISTKGLIFFTNYSSKKALEINENTHVAGTFFWVDDERQVIFQGTCKKISAEKNSAYFHSRPRDSQIGTLASIQDKPISSREELEARFNDIEKLYEGKEIPCPKYWGGYCITPTLFEFWQGAPSRLHDRFRYTLKNNIWKITRLMP